MGNRSMLNEDNNMDQLYLPDNQYWCFIRSHLLSLDFDKINFLPEGRAYSTWYTYLLKFLSNDLIKELGLRVLVLHRLIALLFVGFAV